jgi:hypothetical protein
MCHERGRVTSIILIGQDVSLLKIKTVGPKAIAAQSERLLREDTHLCLPGHASGYFVYRVQNKNMERVSRIRLRAQRRGVEGSSSTRSRKTTEELTPHRHRRRRGDLDWSFDRSHQHTVTVDTSSQDIVT